MIDADGGEDPSSINVQVHVADDKRSAMLRIGTEEREAVVFALDTPSVDALIAALGKTRAQMMEPISNDLPAGFNPLAEFDPRWYVAPDSEERFATFWVRHPGFGWCGYGFPRNEAGNIAKWLRKVTTITATKDTQSSAATSFGGDSFLISTEGLGFYYYGKGESRIGLNPFEQVEFDSDRAAGIVAGSIAERRLEQALRSRLRTDQPGISKQLFRPSGALGPFSVKIELSYLLKILTDEAYRDLVNLKNIRNDFAHDLELDSFDLPSVRDRCRNFALVDNHVGPVPQSSLSANGVESATTRPSPYMGLPDYEHKLADPRFRYMMTAQIISYALGENADRDNPPLPFI